MAWDLQNINSGKMKNVNAKIVLDFIRCQQPVSRKDIARSTRLTIASISNITNELIAQNYIEEIGTTQSEEGRKVVVFGIQGHKGYVIGAELEVSHIRCVITNFKAEVIYQSDHATELEKGVDYVLDNIITIVEEAIEDSGVARDKIIGIGIVAPGPYDQEKGIMVNPPNFKGWKNIPIREFIEKKMNIATYFEKDAVGAVLAEYWIANRYSDKNNNIFALLVNDVGIGGGAIVEGKPYRGNVNGACEIGHSIIDINGPLCSCGNYGCLEAIINREKVIEKVVRKLKLGESSQLKKLVNDYDNINIGHIFEQAERGDQLCVDVVREISNHLSLAVLNIIAMFSPKMIVLCGDMFLESPLLLDHTLKMCDEKVGGRHGNNVDIIKGTFKNYQCAMGAAALVLQNFYTTF